MNFWKSIRTRRQARQPVSPVAAPAAPATTPRQDVMKFEVKKVEIFPGFSITSDDSLVDIGCGDGDNCVAAGEIGAAVYAVDSNQDTLRSVENRMRVVPARLFQSKIAKSDEIPLGSLVASVVVCTEVLEHVADPRYFMRELSRIGRPGARYLLSVPDHTSEAILKIVGPSSYFEAPNHVRVFSRDQFRELVEGAGLVVTEERFVGFYWSMWWAFRFASGSEYCPGAPGEAPAVLRKWEEAWAALLASPEGEKGAALLDLAIPKSQVLMARQPG